MEVSQCLFANSDSQKDMDLLSQGPPLLFERAQGKGGAFRKSLPRKNRVGGGESVRKKKKRVSKRWVDFYCCKEWCKSKGKKKEHFVSYEKCREYFQGEQMRLA